MKKVRKRWNDKIHYSKSYLDIHYFSYNTYNYVHVVETSPEYPPTKNEEQRHMLEKQVSLTGIIPLNTIIEMIQNRCDR